MKPVSFLVRTSVRHTTVDVTDAPGQRMMSVVVIRRPREYGLLTLTRAAPARLIGAAS